MSQTLRAQRRRRTWRAFSPRDGGVIERQIRVASVPCCPCCGEVLEARPGTRFLRQVPSGARAYDMDCRDCRLFWTVVRHTERSLRLVRMRRLVAAVLAAGPTQAHATEQQAPPTAVAV